MTDTAELTKPSTTPSEVFALDIVEGAKALCANPNFSMNMSVASTRFSGPHQHAGHTLYLASEENQPSRTFKSRGARAAIMQAEAEGFERVVTASTGSHGISVGIAAAKAGLRAIVHVPDSIVRSKEERMRSTGAKVVKGGSFLDATERARLDDSSLFVHPFAMRVVRHGQGTFGLGLVDFLLSRGLTGHDGEIAVPVAVAGGSHILGVATAIWDAKRRGLLGEGVKVIGVQPKNNNTAMRARERMQANQESTGLYGRLERQDPGVDALFIGEASLDPDNLALLADTTFVERFCLPLCCRLAD